MNAAVLYVLVALTVSITSSQPTYDLNQVSECGCEKELEALRKQIVLLNEKVDNLNNAQKTPSTSTPSTVTPTSASG